METVAPPAKAQPYQGGIKWGATAMKSRRELVIGLIGQRPEVAIVLLLTLCDVQVAEMDPAQDGFRLRHCRLHVLGMTGGRPDDGLPRPP
jgi:hypothetical protein